jgi:hypothetical protein
MNRVRRPVAPRTEYRPAGTPGAQAKLWFVGVMCTDAHGNIRLTPNIRISNKVRSWSP